MTAKTDATNVYVDFFAFANYSTNITTPSNITYTSTLSLSNQTNTMGQTYHLSVTGYNSNTGATAGAGFFYSEYKAGLYYDVLGDLYVANILGNQFSNATSSPVPLTAANAANNLLNTPSITVRAYGSNIDGTSNAHIRFEIASSDATVTNFYAHIRTDELIRPLI